MNATPAFPAMPMRDTHPGAGALPGNMAGLRIGTRAVLIAAALSLAACVGVPQVTRPEFEASITRTRFGIPHIRATDYGGLGFGAAYARAQDNVCLLADSYVTFAGQRSRFFGTEGMASIGLTPASNLDSDVFHLALPDITRLRTAFSQRSVAYRQLVRGWIAGYNRFLTDHRDRLPASCAGVPWVRAITLDDVLVSHNAFSVLASSGAFAAHLANAAPPASTNASAPATAIPVHDARIGGLLPGSNGWAFGADATHNGKGLVLGNPHFPWLGSNRFYQSHLTIPGELDVAGAAVMTLPYIGIGFNRDVAWTHTVDMAAHMTLFKLALDPRDPTAYFVDGRRENMSRRSVRVAILDGDHVTRTVYVSRYGPIVSVPGSAYAWTTQTAYAVGDANNGNLRSGDTWLDIARARSVKEVRSALARHRGAPFLNTLAADRHGDALYADIASVPDVSARRLADCGSLEARLPGHLQELVVLDGSRATCSWLRDGDSSESGLIPADDMATLFRRDYVQNSNDSHRWTHPDALSQLGPIMGRDPGLGRLRTRAGLEAIRHVLRDQKFDIHLAADTMFSNAVPAADWVLPSLLDLCKRPTAPATACAALAGWDRKAELDSRGAVLFGNFWARVGDRTDIWHTPFDPDDMLGTPRGLITEGDVGNELLDALAAAADEMETLGLAPDVALGQAQFAVRGDERIPVSGLQSGGTLNYTKAIPVTGGYEVIFGASYVQAVGFDDDGPVANAILAYSQSTDPDSAHYADQTREFSKKTLHPFPFSPAQITAGAIGATITIRQ
jgi:acyl-homoserine-lactone acylase